MNLSLSAAASESAFIEKMPPYVEETTYIGKLLLPGNDVVISVTKARNSVYVDGKPMKIGAVSKFILAYANNIRIATIDELEAGSQRIDIIGVWHQNGPNGKSFEPYLVQKIDATGNTISSIYRYRIFHFDHHRSGEKQAVTIEDLDNPIDALDFFKVTTEKMISRDQLPDYVWKNGHPHGVLWCLVPGSDLPPFVYTAVGLSKFRTAAGAELNPNEAAGFDAEKYQRKHDVYMAMTSPFAGAVH